MTSWILETSNGTYKQVSSSQLLAFLVGWVSETPSLNFKCLTHQLGTDKVIRQACHTSDSDLNFLHCLECGYLVVSKQKNWPNLALQERVKIKTNPFGSHDFINRTSLECTSSNSGNYYRMF